MGGKSEDPNKAAMKIQKEQMKRLDQIDLPELEEYILQNPELVGLLDAEGLDSSALEEISLDPQLREKQMQALSSLQQQADEGLTDTDKYAMEQLLGDVASQEQSRQKAIENQMAAQGMDSSGAALMSKLQSKQSSANDARDKAMQMAAQGQQNRRQALQALGQQSGQMESADYGRQANLAQARDTISRYNAQNRQNVNQMNLGARQQIENQRANIANQQAQVGNQINQQNFSNQVSKAGGQGQVASNMSNIAANTPQGPSTMQTIGTIGGGIVGGIYGGPMGAAAGSQAGGAIGGAFEDGGVVQSNPSIADQYKEQELKQRESFKKKYLKSIQDEILPSKKEPVHAQDGALAFNDAFAQARQEQGAGGQFDWQGNSYNTNYADEGRNPAMQPEAPVGESQPDPELEELRQAQGQHDEKLKKDSSDKKKDIIKGLGKLSQVMEQKKAARSPLNLKYQGSPVENIMTPVQAQQFGNVFAAEDGGVAGCNRAEDGDMMYASDGMGDIIDSGMEMYSDDRVDAKVNDGEAILNVPQQQRMMDLLRGKISLTELGDDDIVEGVPKDYRDDLHEKIERESNGTPDRARGLKQLLDLLGEE